MLTQMSLKSHTSHHSPDQCKLTSQKQAIGGKRNRLPLTTSSVKRGRVKRKFSSNRTRIIWVDQRTGPLRLVSANWWKWYRPSSIRRAAAPIRLLLVLARKAVATQCLGALWIKRKTKRMMLNYQIQGISIAQWVNIARRKRRKVILSSYLELKVEQWQWQVVVVICKTRNRVVIKINQKRVIKGVWCRAPQIKEGKANNSATLLALLMDPWSLSHRCHAICPWLQAMPQVEMEMKKMTSSWCCLIVKREQSQLVKRTVPLHTIKIAQQKRVEAVINLQVVALFVKGRPATLLMPKSYRKILHRKF